MADAENPGAATDAGGNPVFDPSKNVLDLVGAANLRQDDLRAAEADHIREVLSLRTALGEQDSKCAAEIAELRAVHARDLRQAEAARIDAIREVDVKAVQQAAEVQATQASVLAQTVATSAETLRTQVAAAANAATIALAAALEPIIKDIADLRRAQYEQQGVKAQSKESRGGVSIVIAGVSAAIALLSILAAVTVALVTSL